MPAPDGERSTDAGRPHEPPLTARSTSVRTLRRLLGRRSERVRAGLLVVEGPVLVAEALDADRLVEVFSEVDPPPAVAAVVAAAEARDVPVRWLAPGVVARTADVVTPQPVLATARRVTASIDDVAAAVGTDGFALVLAGVGDPGNVGTLLRTAEAAGAAAVVLTAGSADPSAPKVVRAAAGSAFRLPVATDVDPEALARLAAAGVRLVGARAAEAVDHDRADLAGPLALVLGSEAHGVPDEVAALVGAWVRVPLAPAVESLNVATAGAVLAFEVAGRRRRSAAG